MSETRGLIAPSLLTDIADAIREKTGSNDTYTPAEMATAIGSITTGDFIDHENIPSYVKAEALEVAKRVRAKMQNDSIVILTGSDSHQIETGSSAENTMAGNLHAGMAMKALTYMIPFDFAAFLGDYTTGSNTTTLAEGRQHFASINAYIDEAFRGLVQFRTVGNHDPLGYSYNQNGEALSQAELYTLIGSYNDDGTTVMGSTTVGYCYRDFASKNLRVICLNTSDKVITKQTGAEDMSNAQITWFANTLISTPQDYGIVILSHHPLDWGSIMPVSEVLRAYAEGFSIAVAGNTVDFAGKNKSAWILQIHGHVHTFTVDNLHYRDGNNLGVAYNVKRIACPCMNFVRTNEYGNNSGPDYYGIEFGTPGDTQSKIAGTAKDTAFCVYVINPSEEKIYSICYGAGYDREVFWGEISVHVTGVTLSDASGKLSPGETVTLTATVAPADATNKGVIWASSNTSVASVLDGVVTAHAVGAATITCTTADGGYTATYTLSVEVDATNIVPLMLDPYDYTAVFQGTGYKDNSYISSGNTGNDTGGHVATGVYEIQDAANISYIYIRGANLSADDHCRFYIMTTGTTVVSYDGRGTDSAGIFRGAGWVSNAEQIDTNYWRLTMNQSFAQEHMTAITRVIRMSVEGTGENLFISINNPISNAVYNAFIGEQVAVTGITLNANSGTAAPGHSVTLTATVVPSNASNTTVLWTSSNTSVATVANGVITAVSEGTATITATTQDGGFTATYALTVETVSGGNLRDYFGYTDGYRLSISTGNLTALTGGTVVEYIDLYEFFAPGEDIVIRTKGINFKKSSSPYNDNGYAIYNASKGFTGANYMTEGDTAHGVITFSKVFANDVDNTMTLTISGMTSNHVTTSYRYLRLAGLGSGANLDIRVNETFD